MDKSISISTYDYTNLPIAWWDVDSSHPGHWHVERFSFVAIKFECPINSRLKDAWFYIGHDSGYLNDPKRFEIVTEKIAGVVPSMRCRIHIDDHKLV